MLRRTFVIPTLQGGGAARVAVNLANHWVANGRELSIVTLQQGPRPIAYDLDPRVSVRDLVGVVASDESRAAIGAILATLPRHHAALISDDERELIAAIRDVLAATRPEAVLSMIDCTNVRVLLAARGLGLEVFAGEHVDPYGWEMGPWEPLRNRLYPAAAGVIALTAQHLRYFTLRGIRRGFAIPNPVVAPAALAPRIETKTVIAVGQLSEAKAFDELIEAFALVAPTHPEWRLEIWGEGHLRPWLEALVQELGMDGRISLPGYTRDVHATLARGSLYALSSLSEGFPNALCEAMACGLPAVAFDCGAGVRAIVRDGIDGLLVKKRTVAALAAALDQLISDDALRATLAARAPEIVERFSIERVSAQWESMLRQSSMRRTSRRRGEPRSRMFVISSLFGGGAERAVVNVANHWAAQGIAVSILTQFQCGRPPAYDLDPRVIHHDLGISGPNRPTPSRESLLALCETTANAPGDGWKLLMNDSWLLALLRDKLCDERPDVVIGVIDLTNIRLLAAARGLGAEVYAWEQIDPHGCDIGPWETLRRAYYRDCAGVVALTPGQLRYFTDRGAKRGAVIPNGVMPVEPRVARGDEKTVIAVGRLAHEKGHELLLHAFARLAERHRDWMLEIRGEGPRRAELERLVERLDLAERVRMPGFTSDVYSALRGAGVFAMTSRVEGFPNALCEAMAFGVPPIVADCGSGVRAIVRHGVDGVLVEREVGAFADALERLIEDDGERARLASRAPEVMERFSIESVAAKWEALFA